MKRYFRCVYDKRVNVYYEKDTYHVSKPTFGCFAQITYELKNAWYPDPQLREHSDLVFQFPVVA